MKRISVVLLTVVVVLTSCNHVYKEYDKKTFSSYMWHAGDEVIFSPKIDDVSKSYKLTLGIRHHYGVQFESISVTITTTSPSGKKTSKDLLVQIRSVGGAYVAKCAGDLCDLEMVLDEKFKFDEAGTYTIGVKQNEAGHVPGIMEVGLIVDEAE